MIIEFFEGVACEYCGNEAAYVDSVPDSKIEPSSMNECGYRPKLFCIVHAIERRQVATSRLRPVVVCSKQMISRLDAGHASQNCVCFCGKEYIKHKSDEDHERLKVLCDGSLVSI